MTFGFNFKDRDWITDLGGPSDKECREILGPVLYRIGALIGIILGVLVVAFVLWLTGRLSWH